MDILYRRNTGPVSYVINYNRRTHTIRLKTVHIPSGKLYNICKYSPESKYLGVSAIYLSNYVEKISKSALSDSD
jgi:hypothetical protein